MAVLISVIIPAYNRAAVIGAAIDSVLKQALPSAVCALEIIVVDDASDDDLPGALRPFGKQVRLTRHDKNMGAAAARNTGVKAAKCDYLAFLDSDDLWLPNKLVKQIAFMRSNGYAISCTACRLVRPWGPDIVWPRHKTGLLTLTDIAWGCILSPGTTMICEPRIFAEIGLFDTNLQRHEDWDWLLRFCSRYDLAYFAEPLAHREPSAFANQSQVIEAIDTIRMKHLSHLPRSVRRSFAAALDIERAAAFYRSGNRAAAAGSLSRSLLRIPFGNRAFAAILHNRLAWPVREGSCV